MHHKKLYTSGLVQRCQVSRCPPLLSGLALSSLAMSVPTILMVSRCPFSRFQSPLINRTLIHRESEKGHSILLSISSSKYWPILPMCIFLALIFHKHVT